MSGRYQLLSAPLLQNWFDRSEDDLFGCIIEKDDSRCGFPPVHIAVGRVPDFGDFLVLVRVEKPNVKFRFLILFVGQYYPFNAFQASSGTVLNSYPTGVNFGTCIYKIREM